MELDHQTVVKLLQDAGAEDVTGDAAEELGGLLEVFAGYITEEAIALANEDGRQVVEKQDIEQALE